MSFRRQPVVADRFGIARHPMPGRHGAMGQAAEEMADISASRQGALCESNRTLETLPAFAATGHPTGQRVALDQSLQPA